MQPSSKLNPSNPSNPTLKALETDALRDYAASLLQQLPEGEKRNRVLSALLMTAINYQLQHLALESSAKLDLHQVSSTCRLDACKQSMHAIVQQALNQPSIPSA